MNEDLVETAFARLLSLGLDDLSAITVSNACGVSKRTFYKEFSSLDMFLERLLGKIAEVVRGEFSRFASPDVKATAGTVEELFTRMPRLLGPHFEKFMLALRKSRPDLVEQFLSIRRDEFQRVAEKIIAGAGKNSLARGISPRVAADMLQVLVDQLATPRYLVESGESMHSVAHTIAQVYLHGLQIGP